MAQFANENKFMFKNSINYKEIIADQLMAIAKISRQEYCGGYWHKTGTFLMGGKVIPLEEYKSDSREEYSNAVECLHDLMKPHFDDDMSEKSTEIFKEIKENRDKWDKSAKKEEDKTNYTISRREIMRNLFVALNQHLGNIKYFDNVVKTRE